MSRVMFHTECFTSNLRAIPIMKAVMAGGCHEVIPFSTFANAGPKTISARLVQNLFQAHGVTPITPADLGLAGAEADMDRAAAEYKQGFEKTLTRSPEAAAVSYRGVPLLKYAWSVMLGHNQFKVRIMSLFEKVLDALRPDVVINGYDFGTLKRFCVTVAQDRGVPTVGLQDGAWTNLRSRRPSEYFLLWGGHFRDMHLADGYDESRLLVAGAPSLDAYLTGDFDRGGLLSQLGLDPDRKTVVVGVSVRDARPTVDQILRRLDQRNDAQLAVKLHPEFHEENRRQYQAVLSGHRTPAALVQHELLDPAALVKASEVMVSYHSNYFFEALALGLELVLLCTPETYQLDQDGRPSSIQFEADKYSRTAWTPDQAADAVIDALDRPGSLSKNDAAEHWRERLYHRLDGQAARRSAQALDQVLGLSPELDQVTNSSEPARFFEPQAQGLQIELG